MNNVKNDTLLTWSQSTIKMDKGSYEYDQTTAHLYWMSQSTIKMDKGSYGEICFDLSRKVTVAIHNKNGQGFLPKRHLWCIAKTKCVAIHNKNGQGFLPSKRCVDRRRSVVAIHNKNGQGFLHAEAWTLKLAAKASQSTIKMDKGSYKINSNMSQLAMLQSQSTIKMDKGSYLKFTALNATQPQVAIHNKNGQGLLQLKSTFSYKEIKLVAIHNKNGQGLLHYEKDNVQQGKAMSQSTIKMDKGYYSNMNGVYVDDEIVAIHNKNGQGLLPYIYL